VTVGIAHEALRTLTCVLTRWLFVSVVAIGGKNIDIESDSQRLFTLRACPRVRSAPLHVHSVCMAIWP